MVVEVYDGIRCEEESCGLTFSPNQIFICRHFECGDKCSIHCQECGAFKHRRKAHTFDPSDNHVISVQDLFKPDEVEYKVSYFYVQIQHNLQIISESVISIRMQNKEQRLY